MNECEHEFDATLSEVMHALVECERRNNHRAALLDCMHDTFRELASSSESESDKRRFEIASELILATALVLRHEYHNLK